MRLLLHGACAPASPRCSLLAAPWGAACRGVPARAGLPSTPRTPRPLQDPHPGNIFALRDGRIAYVDFGNVAELSQRNKEVLVDAVVHAVNEDYEGMVQVGANNHNN